MNSAYHHVELSKHPVKTNEEDKQVFFDECNRQLVSITDRGICCTPLEGENKGERKYIGGNINRPSIICAKFSPDKQYLVIQFSPLELEIIDLVGKTSFVHAYKKSKTHTNIVAFFWTFDDNFFVLLNGTIELYSFPKPPKRPTMKPVKDHKCTATWMHYSSKHRILLASNCTPSGNNGVVAVQPFYFKPNIIIKMPKLEIDGVALGSQSLELIVHQLYDAIYCIHLNSHRKELVLYQLTKEAVIRRVRLDILTAGTSHIHVVDNLLLVHNLESKVTMMFDIKSKNRDTGGGFPVASPLPLSPLPYEPDDSIDSPRPSAFAPRYPQESLYSDSWRFYLPNYIMDVATGCCWTVGLNLDGIVMSLSDRCKMAEFLLRRTLPRTRIVLLRELLALILEHEAISVVANVYDALNVILAAHLRRTVIPPQGASNANNNNNGEQNLEEWTTIDGDNDLDEDSKSEAEASSRASLEATEGPVVITQSDMYTHVFAPVEEKALLDHKFTVAVVTEYIRSLNFHHISVTPFLYKLLINFLVHNNRFYQLHQFLQYHVVSDSTHVACQLLSMEQTYPAAYQLALDMLKRLNTYDQIVEVLLSKQLLLPALKFMRSHKVKVPPRRVLEVASQCSDNTVFFACYRFFENRKELGDCDEYVRKFQERFSEEKRDSLTV